MNPSSADSPTFSSPPLLPGIRSPSDLKGLAAAQLPQLAAEIREEIISVTAQNGGAASDERTEELP